MRITRLSRGEGWPVNTVRGHKQLRTRVNTGRNSCICEIRSEKTKQQNVINIKIKKEGARGNYITRRTLEYA